MTQVAEMEPIRPCTVVVKEEPRRIGLITVVLWLAVLGFSVYSLREASNAVLDADAFVRREAGRAMIVLNAQKAAERTQIIMQLQAQENARLSAELEDAEVAGVQLLAQRQQMAQHLMKVAQYAQLLINTLEEHGIEPPPVPGHKGPVVGPDQDRET